MATATKRGRGVRVPRQTREQMLDGLKQAREQKGKDLSQSDFAKRRFDLLPVGHYEREFGTVKDAILIAAEPVSEPKDAALTEAMEQAAPEPKPAWETTRGIVTIEKQGVSSVVQADDITNVVRMIRFVGDDTTADILASWVRANEDLPTGPSYSYSARAGETTITLQVV